MYAPKSKSNIDSIIIPVKSKSDPEIDWQWLAFNLAKITGSRLYNAYSGYLHMEDTTIEKKSHRVWNHPYSTIRKLFVGEWFQIVQTEYIHGRLALNPVFSHTILNSQYRILG